MSKKSKFCVDCKFCADSTAIVAVAAANSLGFGFQRVELKGCQYGNVFDLVTGEKLTIPSCAAQRADDGECGPLGKYFKSKLSMRVNDA